MKKLFVLLALTASTAHAGSQAPVRLETGYIGASQNRETITMLWGGGTGKELSLRYAERLDAGFNGKWVHDSPGKVSIKIKDAQVRILPPQGNKPVYRGVWQVMEVVEDPRRSIKDRLARPKTLVVKGRSGFHMYEASPKPGLVPLFEKDSRVNLTLRVWVNGVLRRLKLPQIRMLIVGKLCGR